MRTHAEVLQSCKIIRELLQMEGFRGVERIGIDKRGNVKRGKGNYGICADDPDSTLDTLAAQMIEGS